MRRSLDLAMNGRGHVEPNPMVGCVLVRDGSVIGEGWHTHFGGPHAEPSALADCVARGHSPAGATAYVTLEPCCHLNKKTPPCAPRLIYERIARVVIGCLDPNPNVNGQGVALLQAAGVTVDAAPAGLAAQFKQLIAPFLLAEQLHRPYVTMKWAVSADGFVGAPGRTAVRISSPEATAAVHRLRSRCDAVGVGVGTMISDDPMLTVRGVSPLRMPLRFVLDRSGRTPAGARMRHDGGPPVRIIKDLAELDDLAGRHLLIEPGPILAAALLPRADRLWIIRSPRSLGDGVRAIDNALLSDFDQTAELSLGGDTLREYLNRRSPAFHAARRSADFELERRLAVSGN